MRRRIVVCDNWLIFCNVPVCDEAMTSLKWGKSRGSHWKVVKLTSNRVLLVIVIVASTAILYFYHVLSTSSAALKSSDQWIEVTEYPCDLSTNEDNPSSVGHRCRDLQSSSLRSIGRTRRSHCLVTLKGKKDFPGEAPIPNQDRAILLRQEAKHQQSSSPGQFLLALFDGHGPLGHLTAQGAVVELAEKLWQWQTRQKHTDNGQRSAEEAFDHSLRQHISNAFQDADKSPAIAEGRVGSSSGCTGVIVQKISSPKNGEPPMSDRIVLSTVGDSTAWLVQWSRQFRNATIIHSAIHHKPALPIERQRIEAAGGTVIMPEPLLLSEEQKGGVDESPFTSSRVLIPDSFDESDPSNAVLRALEGGQPLAMALAMSRSLGDTTGKRLGYLTAEPTIEIFDLVKLRRRSPTPARSDEFFVVVSSDGAVDFVTSPVSLVQRIGEALFADPVKTTPSLSQQPLMDLCYNLIQESSRRWAVSTTNSYRDDMTFAVVPL
jgi:serine/threonine protein phosphatase PrpC